MNTLPQTILNLIGEFNASHRDQMCDVLMEFDVFATIAVSI